MIKQLISRWKSAQMQLLGAKIAKTHIRYDSQGHFDSAVLQQARKSNMDKDAIKSILYGGIAELMDNRTYFHKSSMDPKYSHWHDKGKEAVLDFIDFASIEIQKSQDIELNTRAKELTMKALKGETP